MHIVSVIVYNLTSESKTSAASKSPVKKGPGPKGTAPRSKTKSRTSAAVTGEGTDSAQEERLCPVDGCNSLGHLGGRLERHYTREACPVFHNKTVQECKVLFKF